MILLQHLTKKLGAQVAVDDLSFEVPAGQIVGFLGPNGAGKSTTLKRLTGMIEPSGGTATGDLWCDIDGGGGVGGEVAVGGVSVARQGGI